MSVPASVGSVPGHFGKSIAGTLKADELCTLALIYLPTALITMWGIGTLHEDEVMAQTLRRVLDHTMLLVCAVQLACQRTISEATVASYRRYITDYMKALKHVHPKAKYTPNLHFAVHISDFLHLFGPVHSWWTFPFERLIGQLQHIPSNHRHGEVIFSVHM